MAKLNMYQEARLDVLKVFYRYHRMSKSELCNSSINEDLEIIFDKWKKLKEVEAVKKDMRKSMKIINKTKVKDDLLYELYKDCISDMLHALSISDAIDRAERNVKFCQEMKKAQDRYFSDDYY